jgi:O-acetyl-ADP-ribose deacetylase (regulator of RNase III)
MSIAERHGDLFSAPVTALAHGCNCAGAMSKGIALEFRKRWPEMYERYRELCRLGEFQPGDVFIWDGGDRVIFNLATQRSWRTKATPEAIAGALNGMTRYARRHDIREIAMPRIGAGLGGMRWAVVRAILEDAVPDELHVLVYQFPPAN